MIVNAMGPRDSLKALSEKYPRVVDKFGLEDWNFDLDDEDVDAFLEEAEVAGVKTECV